MRFIKGHIYSCAFVWGGQELPAVFYGIYTHTIDKNRYFKYISCENYGNWHATQFSFEICPNITFTNLGTVKQNPELFI